MDEIGGLDFLQNCLVRGILVNGNGWLIFQKFAIGVRVLFGAKEYVLFV